MLRVTDIFWRVLPKLRFVQFPWRWMCVLAVCYAFFLAWAFERTRRGWIVLVAVALLSVGTAAVLIQEGWWDTEDLPTLRAAITNGSGFDGTDEYDPRGDDHYDLAAKAPDAAVLAAEDADDAGVAAPAARVRIEKWSAAEKRLLISSPGAARMALRLLDYPAWRVEVNGKTVVPEHAEGTAQMVVPVSAGDSEIRVRFITTWDRRWGGVLSLLSAIIVVLMMVVGWRAKAS
jgi:hypothetical protein